MVVTCFEGAGWKLLFLPCLLWNCLPVWGDFTYMLTFLTTQGVLSIYENIKGCVTFMTFLLMIWTKKAIMNWYRTQCLEREFFLKLIYLLGTAVISVSVVPYIWFPLYEFYDCIAERIMPAPVARVMKKFRDLFFLITSLVLAVHCLSQTDLFRRVRPMKPPNPNAPLLPRNVQKTLRMIYRILYKIFKFILRTAIGFYKVTMRTIRDCPVVGNYAPASDNIGVGFIPMMGESGISVDDDGTGTFLSNLWKVCRESWYGPGGKRGEMSHSKRKPQPCPKGARGGEGDSEGDENNMGPDTQTVNQRRGRGRGRPNRVVMEARYGAQKGRKRNDLQKRSADSNSSTTVSDNEQQELASGIIGAMQNAYSSVIRFFTEDDNEGLFPTKQPAKDDAFQSSDTDDDSVSSLPHRPAHRYMTRSRAKLCK